MNEINLPLISALSVLLPLIVGISFFKTLTLPVRVLLFLFVISLVTDYFAHYLNSKGITNLFILNIYTLVEYACYAYFYYLLLQKYKYKKVLTGILVSGFIVALIVTLAQNIETKMNAIAMGLESLMFITISLIYFDIMLKSLNYAKAWSNPYFWINSAILFYFSGSFFIFIFVDFVNERATASLWVIHHCVRVIFNILITIGIWKSRKTST